MANLLSFFVHKETHEIALAHPTSHTATAQALGLKYRGNHAEWIKGLWRRGKELILEGGDDAMRQAVLRRFPTRDALIAHAKMLLDDEDFIIITTQAQADAITALAAGTTLVVDADVTFPHLHTADHIAVGSFCHATFPALQVAREIIVWGQADFPILPSISLLVMWGKGAFNALHDADKIIVPACGNPLFPALEAIGVLVGNGLSRIATPKLHPAVRSAA